MNSLWEAFTVAVQSRPAHCALICGTGYHSLAQLAARVEDYRSSYLAGGAGPGDRVLLWMENSFDMAAATTACWGNDLIPVLANPGGFAPQLLATIEQVAPAAVVHQGALPLSLDDRVPLVVDCTALLAGAGAPVAYLPQSQAGDVASIVFTSGSSGRPKGVMQSHHNLYSGCQSVFSYLGLRSDDVLLCPVPWSFDYGFGQLLSTLIFGITQVVPQTSNPAGICAAIECDSPTVMAGTPSIFGYLTGGMSPIEETDCSSLRLLTSTGGQLVESVCQKLLAGFPCSDLVLNYGLTETYRSCYIPPGYVPGDGSPLGVAVPGVDVVVVREDGSLAEAGESGEIVHRGDFVFLGYWGDPLASAEVIRPDPCWSSGDSGEASKCVFTGDIGYTDEDGFLYYLGRRDRLLKSMGVRVSPQEVEGLLMESGMLQEAAVFALPHDLLGDEIHAAVVPIDADDFRKQSLNKFARANMSQYMLPRVYKVLENLPLTSTGKVDYCHLETSASASRAVGSPAARMAV